MALRGNRFRNVGPDILRRKCVNMAVPVDNSLSEGANLGSVPVFVTDHLRYRLRFRRSVLDPVSANGSVGFGAAVADLSDYQS